MVWFSALQVWEPTASKGLLLPDGSRRTLTRAETADRGGGLFRISPGPGVTLHTWRDFKRLSGASQETIRGLVRAAKAVGSDPEFWSVSFEPMPDADWADVQEWVGERWTDVARRGTQWVMKGPAGLDDFFA